MNQSVSVLPSDYNSPHRCLPRRFHTARETPTNCSRRRKEADLLGRTPHPPPHVGGYKVCETFGRVALIAIVLVVFELAFSPRRTSGQIVGPWGHGASLPFLQGPTLVDTLRNGAQAASDQSRNTAQFARDLSQRARGVGYQMQNFSADYQNLVYQFQNLRYTFNALGQLALQLQTPQAANAVAELEAGLNIISEAFTPMQQEMQAGAFNPDTIQRMCGAINQALLEWQKELKRCSARLGTLR